MLGAARSVDNPAVRHHLCMHGDQALQKLLCRTFRPQQRAFDGGTKTQFSHSWELHHLTCMTVMLPKDDDKYRVSL